MIKIFYDVETTGLNPKLHSVHQLAGIVEVDGSLVGEFNYKVRPHPKAEITKEAMSACNKSEEEILGYPEMSTVHKRFVKMLGKYVSKYDAKQKIKDYKLVKWQNFKIKGIIELQDVLKKKGLNSNVKFRQKYLSTKTSILKVFAWKIYI